MGEFKILHDELNLELGKRAILHSTCFVNKLLSFLKSRVNYSVIDVGQFKLKCKEHVSLWERKGKF